MTQKERFEISMLPEKYRPMGAWGYVGYSILFAIPIVGLICLIVFALSDANISRRSFARSVLLGALICVLLSLVATALVLLLPGVYDQIMAFLEPILSALPA